MPPIRNNNQDNVYNKNPFPVTTQNNKDVQIDPIMNFGIVFAGTAVILSAILFYFNYKYSKDLAVKKELINRTAQTISGIPIEEMSVFYNKYKLILEKENGRGLLNTVFEYLSLVVVPGVYFDNFNFKMLDNNKGSVSLNANAADVKRAILQMDSFKNSKYNKDILDGAVQLESFKDENGKYQISVKMIVKTNVKDIDMLRNTNASTTIGTNTLEVFEDENIDYSTYFNKNDNKINPVNTPAPNIDKLNTDNIVSTNTDELKSVNINNVNNINNATNTININNITATNTDNLKNNNNN